MNSVRQLWDLQQLDLQQIEKQKLLKENKLLKDLCLIKNEVTTGVEEFKKQKADYKQLKMAITVLEAQVQELKTNIEHLNDKLSDGSVPNHKDVAVIYAEVQQLQQRIVDIENEELILIEKQEDSKSKLEQKSAYLKERKALYDQLKADYQAFKQDLKQQIAVIISNKEQLKCAIKDDSMLLYQGLLKRYLNPVAVVKDGICGGCHLALTAQQRNQLRVAQSLVKCDHCGRLIFINDKDLISINDH
ncbi:C4-type zinc ribbon domain-containing protein [Peptococcaceae bacterium 1198_IL3148]